MEKKIAKPKFVAPMITANSFLKALCKSPEVHRPQTKRASVIKEFIPSFPLKHDSIFRTLESPTVRSQIVIKSPKFTRDISHLKDSLKESKSDSFLPPLQHILPTSPEHLRKYLNANETHSRCNSPGHLCNKEKCLNEFLDRSFDKLETKKSREDHSRINLQLGLPTGKNDISNLKDWYEGMKSAHFNKLVNSPNASLYENFENDLEVMGLVVRAGLKECVRQVKVQSIDRGEVLEELLQNFEFFWKGKNVNIVNTLKMRFKALKQKKQNLKENTKKFENERIENEKKYNQEIGVMKSLGLLKDVEIERLALNIKKLKAERVFRIRKELETYNEMLRKFKEYRETASAKFEENNLNRPEDPSQTAIRRKLLKTKDSIKEILLAKLNLIEKGAEKNSRLTEEQLIEHEMLILDEEFPFKDAEIQVNILPHTKDFGANAIVPTQSVEIETDEILQIFSMESDQEELTNFPKLILTNEDNEESIKFPGLQKSLEKDLKNNKNPRAIFQFRAKMEKVSQTDDKIFLEIMKKEEDEITNWMREDREKYLRGVQRQIFQKKGELSKVNDLIAKNRSKLGDSMQVEDILQMSIGSNSEQIDVLIDLEIENLRKNGILGEEIEIESWKQGYYFGYDKGKIEGYAEGERLGLEKADLDKDLVSSFDYGETNEITRKRSARKSTLGVSDFKKAKNFTKVQEFKFQRKNSRISTAKIEHKQHLLKSFLSESLKEIVKNTKMSRKMTLKTISTIYSSMISKKATHAYNLADFTFEEFCSKYGQKVVASKKFVDFVAALLKYPDSRKAINFSKLLGISHKLGLEDYIRPKETFAFMSVLLEKIENSTLGIVIGIDETSDYQFIPKIRAVECTKELISPYVDNGKLNAILEIIDKNSHPDPKKINKSGIIDQELLQEILLNEFDGHYKNVIDRLGMLFGGIMMEARPLQVYKLDFIMLLRVVSPLKFASFIGVNDPIEVLNRICESNPLVNYESTEKLMDLCIKYNLLQNYEFETGTTLEQARNIITNGLKENQNLLRYVFTHREEFNLTEEYSLIWEDRLNKIQENEFFHPGLLVMIWGVLLSEIKRITSKNSENIAGN